MTKRTIAQLTILAPLVLVAALLVSQAVSARITDPETTFASSSQQVFDQEAKLAELRKQIAGKEQLPAETVFKNIQFLKGVPAGRVLAIMKIGYSRSLGVTCTHCHVVDAWEKDDKPTKQTARDMAQMVRTINNDLLKNIKNLKSESPVINCTTCHRGQIKPALDLTEAVPKTE
jgi:hypothetical protein